VHAIGRDVVAQSADDVDRNARFPHEALAALKTENLLSAYVPQAYGGLGLNIRQLAKLCEALGQYDASTAMIFAMHQIQVGCIVHHALESDFFRDYASTLVAKQFLIASATTEVGVGGDVRSSICALKLQSGRFALEKQAPVISYGEAADAILVTCRKSEDAARSDQVMALVRRPDYDLKRLNGWDTLGFRGTCSCGFALTSAGGAEQILPVPYAVIHSKTMHPFAHIVWGSLWLGLATDALNRARVVVRQEARKNPSGLPISATRLAEADVVLHSMRSGLDMAVADYHDMLIEDRPDAFSNFGFATRMNSLKIASSQLVIDVVSRAMIICGIAGYRNDSKASLGRHLRDAYGASIMVNNDRILGQSAMMHMGQRDA
jgi:acyl-CoA dehydrogenase